MRHRIGICLLCILCLLTACGQKEPETTDWTPMQMAQAVLDTQDAWGILADVFLFRDAEFEPYLSDYYGVEPGDVEDGYILCEAGVSALEVAVLRLKDGANTGQAVRALMDYIDRRAGAFAGYAPEQYAILEKSAAVSRGQYVALLICPDMDAAEKAFANCFTSAPPPVQEGAPPPLPSEEAHPPARAAGRW